MIGLLAGLCASGVVIGLVLIGSNRSRTAPQSGCEVGSISERARRLDRLSRRLTAGALLWVVAAALALFFVPMITEETQSTTAGSSAVTVTRVTRPLLETSGVVRTGAVAVAALVIVIGWRLGRPPRSTLFVLGYLSLAFCVVTGFSIGILFVPVPLLLLAAAALTQSRPSRVLEGS